MTETETEEFFCELIVKPALYMMEARLPMRLVNRVNGYIDGVRDSAADHSNALVGQIRQNPRSAQLNLDLRESVPRDLANEIAAIGGQYVKMQGYRAAVTPTVIWSVHSYEGDYNPLHDHGGNTPLGLSSILYLKIPDVIAAKDAVAHGGAPKLHMASGNCDGFTQFVWGATGMRDFSLLRPPTQQYVKPEAGKLLVFPNWLLHRVEPFFGPGERRTLSCNMDVVFDEPSWY
jgi:putative 2-oxoglutarate-Fe(II)-dependent oxygenase superfamily protein